MPLVVAKSGQTGMDSDRSGTSGDKIGTGGWPLLSLFGAIAGYMLTVFDNATLTPP